MDKIRSFNQAFEILKRSFLILIVSTILIVVCCLATMVYVYRTADKKVYVVGPSQSYQALSDYDHQFSIYEIRNQIKVFCFNMFSWDKGNYTMHLEQGLNLVDHEDGLKIFNTFKENEIYENLVSTNARVSIFIDSIYLDMSALPFSGKFYLTQTWETAAGKQSQGIAASFQVLPVSRTEQNPYGLILQKIYFIRYNYHKNKPESLFNQNTGFDQDSITRK